MGYKEDFWQAIDEELPESIADLLEVTIDFSGVTYPSDPDSAAVETGKLAAKLNAILDSLNGLSLVELALRIGQKNVTSKLMLLAALEYAGASSSDEETAKENGFEVLVPKEGNEYDAWTFPFQAQRLDPTIDAIACLVDDSLEVALTRDGNLFSGSPQELMHPGEHTATFTASNEKSLAVTFSIAELEIITYPADGDTVPPVFEARAKVPEGMTSASVTIKRASDLSVVATRGLPWSEQKYVGKSVIDLTPLLELEEEDWLDLIADFMAEGGGASATKQIPFTARKALPSGP